jgi:beta-galactosidase
MPAVLSISNPLLEILERYVEEGGRLVMDAPGAWLDDYGRMLSTDRGTPFQRIFGCSISDFQYSSNVPRFIAGERLSGFVLDIEMMGADVLLRFDDGRAAATLMRHGAGTAVLLGFEASMSCFRPGNDSAEKRLLDLALGGVKVPFTCEGALAYRLASPSADHYFLVNDGPATEVSIIVESSDLCYLRAEDAVTGEALGPNAPIPLPPYGGRWVRLEKERRHEDRSGIG